MDLHPTRLTTRSFELLMSAVDMVRNDAPEVRHAILASNPYSSDVLRRFKSLTSKLDDPGVVGEWSSIFPLSPLSNRRSPRFNDPAAPETPAPLSRTSSRWVKRHVCPPPGTTWSVAPAISRADLSPWENGTTLSVFAMDRQRRRRHPGKGQRRQAGEAHGIGQRAGHPCGQPVEGAVEERL